jgi:plasmid stabilization system protein ParE
VAQVVFSTSALGDIEHALEGAADARVGGAAAIRSALESLATHPFIGRRLEEDLRELVISFGATGCIALYRFDVQQDQVRVLALRRQREMGYLP